MTLPRRVHRTVHGSKVEKKSFVIFSILLSIFIGLAAITNVPTDVTPEDEVVFRYKLWLNPQTMRPQSFDDEIKIIRLVQQKIINVSKGNLGIREFDSREPSDLFIKKSNMCYDRSRSIEKALNFMGFQVRHVYLLYAESKSFMSAIFSYHQGSHAATEVKTSRGWILVDSNSAWVSLAKNNVPIPADQVWQSAEKFSTIPNYFKSPFWTIRGLYSRKGFFYYPYIPFPEFNWHDFLSSLAE
jgi:hypothetical protein